MIRAVRISLLTTALLASTAVAQAPVERPDIALTRGQRVPDVTFLSADSTSFHLDDMLGKPVILNPVFTSCQFTCPQITSSLRDALAGIGEPEVGYHVLTVSFDPADGPAQLREYRDRLNLPPGWRLAVASPEELARLLDAIDFHYVAMEDGGFAHPNVIAIINPEMKVASYVNGVTYDSDGIRRALEQAVRETGLVHKARPLLLLVSALGLVTTIVVIVATGRKQRRMGAA